MTPHDIELKRYNDIMIRLGQIEAALHEVYDDKGKISNYDELNDKVFLSLVYLRDIKDKFKRYANQDDI